MSDNVREVPKFSKELKSGAQRLAKLMTLHCARNTSVENLHCGTFPGSRTGDSSDVKVVTPYGEIPWNKLSRISDQEMKTLNKEIVNKVFTFLLYLQKEDLPQGPRNLYSPTDWDDAQIDPTIKGIWDRAREQKNKTTVE